MTVYSSIQSNVRNSYLLVIGFIITIYVVTYIFSEALGYGNGFVYLALFISIFISIISYYFSDSIVLTMSGAREADKKQYFDFYTVAENMSIAAGVPMPKLYVIDDTAMNAFATGRDPKHAIICATTGLLSRLERREIEGVVAHELSHIQNYDIRFMALVAVLVGTLVYLSDLFLRNLWWRDRGSDKKSDQGIFLLIGIVLALLTPILATVMKMAASRQREYLADAPGVLLTRNPEGLASALLKISKDTEVLEAATNATAHLYIANPFEGKKVHAWFSSLFSTHPPIEERVKRLRSM